MQNKRELTPAEKRNLEMKFEIATELGLMDKVTVVGWKGLTARESGRIGGIMGRRNQEGRRKADGEKPCNPDHESL